MNEKGNADDNCAVSVRRPHWMERQGYVYFLTDGEHIKIGFSVHVPGRIAQHRHQLKIEPIFIAKFLGWHADEKRLHRRFWRARTDKYGQQEWFKTTPALLACIDQLKAADRWIASRRTTIEDVLTGKFRSLPMPKGAPSETREFVAWVRKNRERFAGTEVEKCLVFAELSLEMLGHGGSQHQICVKLAQQDFANLERAISAHAA